MNFYAWVILCALLVEYALTLVAHVLNVRNLLPIPPPEFAGVYEPEAYQRSQTYTQFKTKFSIVHESFELLLTLAFWFAGGFNLLDLLVRQWGFGTLAAGISYIGILLLCRALFTFPFSLYSTFVIEEKYGFNKTIPATFLADRCKGLALSVVLGGPLLAGVLALFEYGGPIAWLYCWVTSSSVLLLIQFIAPTVILPLFNKFTPLPDGELRSAILSYARSIRFPVEDISVMDGSRRSRKTNAFFTGFGRHKRIVLFDTLIGKHSIPELVSVIAHEMGHYKKRHIVVGLSVGILHLGLIFGLVSITLTRRGLFDAFFMQHPSVYAGLIFFGMLFTPAEFLLGLGMNMLSRHHEFEADRFAVETVGDAIPLINALKKLSTDNLSNVTPHPLDVFLHYSHPPVTDRIRSISPISPSQ